MAIRKASTTTSINKGISAAVASTVNDTVRAVGGSGPVITNVIVTDSSYTNTDDTALTTAGGYLKLIGTGFASGCTVYVGAAAASSTTFVSSTEVRVVVGANSLSTLNLYLVNTDGSASFYLSGLLISGVPSWSTGATLTGAYEQVAYSQSLTATGDATISYSLKAGSTLPTGVTLNTSTGLLSGTTPVEASSTTYTFTIIASDGQNQDTERLFSLTIAHDVVTWSTPAADANYAITTGDPITTVTLSASSASAKAITYTADTLPTGLSLASGSITGTPTVGGAVATTLTATAADTSATATRSISWTVSVALTGDSYAGLISLYLNGETPTPTWLDDASDNNLVVTNRSDFRTNAAIVPTGRTPYNKTTYPDAGSAWFAGEGPDGPGAYDTLIFQMPALGTVFTVELWFYADEASPGLTATKHILISGSGFNISIVGNRGLAAGIGGYAFQTATGVFSAYTWNHVAVVRTGTGAGLFKMYLNGTLVTLASGAFTHATTPVTTAEARIGGSTTGYQNLVRGNIADVRLVDGTAVYTGNFAAPTAPLTAISGTVFLALQYKQGTTNSGFIDDSTNGFPIIRSGNVGQGSFSPYGPTGYSAYFDGTGDYLTTTGFGLPINFTLEFWSYLTAQPSGGHFTAASSSGPIISIETLKTILGQNGSYFFNPPNDSAVYPNGVSPLNQWNHWAVVRDSGTITFYLNGIRIGTGSNSADYTASQTFGIGAANDGTPVNVPHYMSNFRFSSVARYSGTNTTLANFSLPTADFTSDADTIFLGLQGNRFKDFGPNNRAITVLGDTKIVAFSPFTPYTEYSAATHGGSMGFDGSGDFLALPSSANLAPGTVFTFECWIYGVVSPSNQIIYSSTTSGQLAIGYQNSSNWGIASRGTAWLLTSATIPITNQWNHIVASRGGTGANQTSLFLNGARVANGTVTNAFNVTAPYQIGYDGGGGGSAWNGYISNLRLVPGVDVYGYTNTTITVPTAPLTAISGTQLLLKGTDGGIVDKTGRNVIETAGYTTPEPGRRYPEIRTQVKKYGNSSIFFGGTGDYLLMNGGQNFAFGTGNFTIEFWVNITVNGVFYDSRPTSTDGVYITIASDDFPSASGSSVSLVVSGSRRITGTTVIKDGTWHHVAVCRSATTTKLFVDGVQTGSSYSDSNNYLNGANRPVIASQGYTLATSLPIGYIDDFRITTGAARYTSNFSPPTESFNLVGPTTRSMQYLVVGAGGGAGHYFAGGGGGGGVQASTVSAVTGVTYTVTVGAGGVGNASTGGAGANGNASAITGGGFGIQATGGLGGGGINEPARGESGASAHNKGGKSGAPQNYTGGASTLNVGGVYRSGGGGGAGAVGVAGAAGVNPDGGVGYASSITGTSIQYGGGGGGAQGTVSGNWGRGSPFTLGIGGGGAGGGTAVASNRPGDIYGVVGAPGIANLGGGGGGGSTEGGGGNGGSGVAIIKIADSIIATVTGSPSLVTSGGYNVYTFNSTGTISLA